MIRNEISWGRKKFEFKKPLSGAAETNYRRAKSRNKKEADKSKDAYKNRLLDFFPGEVVAVYTTLWGFATLAKEKIPFDIVTWIIFAVGIAGVILIYILVNKIKNWLQILLAVIAFATWALTINSPFSNFPLFEEFWAPFILVIVTFFLPIFTHIER